MLGRVKAFCLHSATIAWGYVLAIAGSTMAFIDNIGDALGDPTLRDQLSTAIGTQKPRDAFFWVYR